ncbi:MAG: hypothetical protein ABSF53_17225 [Terracidiphilus sp.]|jgi:hypothetical protein
MRSDLVFNASVHVPNRYQLTRLVSIATRALHRPGTRIQDTMNHVLTQFGEANPIAYLQTEQKSAHPAVHSRKPLRSRSREVMLELERIVAGQPVQISRSTANSPSNSFDPSALPRGVMFTTVNPRLPAQQAE